MSVLDKELSGSGPGIDLWMSAAEESLRLCRKCSGLTKQSSTLQYLLSPDGLQFRAEVGYLRESSGRGCPFCSVVYGKLKYDLENTPELQSLRKRNPRIFSRNLVRRQTRSYRLLKFVFLRMRAPWNEFSDTDEPLDEDFEEIEMHYKVPKKTPLQHARTGETYWNRLLEFNICAISGEQYIRSDRNRSTQMMIGDAAADLISTRPLTEDPGSEESFHQAKKWIENCCSSHDSCPKPGNTLPTRVVDVGDLRSNQPPILFISNGAEAPYTALSYCWGEPPPKPQPPQPVMTTTATIDNFKEGLPVSLLPQTIKDAIHTTRQLGFRYLWVDVLCILQDDKVDKHKEIRKMKEIFSNAVVTISAACSESCHKGFLYQRDLYRDSVYHRSQNTKPPYVSLEYPPFLLPFRCPDGRLGSLILHQWMTTRPAPEPINSRAWTLEERLLSPRVLVYSSIQVLWECQDGMKMLGPNIFEPIYQPRLKQILFEYSRQQFTFLEGERIATSKSTAFETQTNLHGVFKIEELRESWIEILEDYTSRKMTLAEDRLLAISGIAAVFAKGFNTSQYKAGMWYTEEEQKFFLSGLLWDVVPQANLQPVPGHNPARPSWSWATIDGAVHWQGNGSHAYARSKNNIICQVLECSVVLESNDLPFGNVESGILKILGPLKKFKTITSDRYTAGMELNAQGERFKITEVHDAQGGLVPSFHVSLDSVNFIQFGNRENETKFSEVWALLLLKSMGLLLSPAGDGTYRRVGMFFWNDERPWFDDGDLQELSAVTIL
jgi:Heterokaryon incompatibility protein (HET)